jgi:hypothetical protein
MTTYKVYTIGDPDSNRLLRAFWDKSALRYDFTVNHLAHATLFQNRIKAMEVFLQLEKQGLVPDGIRLIAFECKMLPLMHAV